MVGVVLPDRFEFTHKSYPEPSYVAERWMDGSWKISWGAHANGPADHTFYDTEKIENLIADGFWIVRDPMVYAICAACSEPVKHELDYLCKVCRNDLERTNTNNQALA